MANNGAAGGSGAVAGSGNSQILSPRTSGGALAAGGTAGTTGVTSPSDAGNAATSSPAPQAPSLANPCDPLSQAQIQQYASDIMAFFTQSQTGLNVLGTTTSPLGMILDWIDPNSQSKTHGSAAVPPAPDVPEMTDPAVTALESGLLDPWLAANPKLVPIPRVDVATELLKAWNCLSLDDVLSKYGDASDQSVPPTEAGGGEVTPDAKWAHHYASTRQYGAVYGTSALLQVNNPFVWQDNEFSLAQTALASQSSGTLQTIEVGWQKSRFKYHDDFPHLFVYYTTNAYSKEGHFLGGYNHEVFGWEQVSHLKFPGDALVIGSELAVTIHMYGGNWWVGINGEWIGFFPASLFAASGLGSVGDQVSWYGEIIDDRADNVTTYTQMGNGQFAGVGSAYIRNILFESINQYSNYAPSLLSADKPGCYTLVTYPSSGTNWGSYFLYGGPGKSSPTCL